MNEPESPEQLWQPIALVPTEFGLLELLGEGGYGCVYKAVHKILDRKVAIKFIRKDNSASEESMLALFQKEAKAVSRLDHQNIVKVLQVGKCSDNTPFLVYEFLEGTTLKTYLEKNSTISARALQGLASQLLAALDHSHKNGVIHRDIKPSNIMLLSDQINSSFFQVKLLDFGMARTQAAEGVVSQDTISSAKLAGTPAYMSPEQCKGEKAEQQSDFYSLACVLYECLLGKQLFEADSPLHLQYKQINDEPQLPDKRLSKEMNAFLSKSLSKSPSLRPANAKECERELRSALKIQEGIEEGQTQSKGLDRRVFALVLLSCLILVGTILGKNYLSKQSEERSPAKQKSESEERILKNASPSTKLKRFRHHFVEQKYMDSKENLPVLLKELDNDIIPASRKQAALLFAAYDAKAKILQIMDKKEVEVIKVLQQAADLCVSPDAKTYAEASQCYHDMALQYQILGDIPNVRKYAQKAIDSLRKSQTDGNPCLTSGDLSTVDIRKVLYHSYHLLAYTSYTTGNYQQAEKECKLAIEAFMEAFNKQTQTGQESSILLADIHLAEGHKDQAFHEIENIEKLTKEDYEKSELGFESANMAAKTMLGCGNWYLKNGKKLEARRAFEEVLHICQNADYEKSNEFKQATAGLAQLSKLP